MLKFPFTIWSGIWFPGGSATKLIAYSWPLWNNVSSSSPIVYVITLHFRSQASKLPKLLCQGRTGSCRSHIYGISFIRNSRKVTDLLVQRTLNLTLPSSVWLCLVWGRGGGSEKGRQKSLLDPKGGAVKAPWSGCHRYKRRFCLLGSVSCLVHGWAPKPNFGQTLSRIPSRGSPVLGCWHILYLLNVLCDLS